MQRSYCAKLKADKFALRWKKRQKVLDELPRTYTPELYQQKCDVVYQHVFDSYSGAGVGMYAAN